MKLFMGLLLTVALPSAAYAEEASVQPRLEVVYPDPALLDFGAAASPEAPQSHTIYLNRCAGGCTIYSGNESAANNTSSIVSQGAHTFSQWSYGDGAWNDFVDCMREVYAPFDINIVTERPTSGVYWMNIVAGTAQQGGFQQGVLGVSPGYSGCPLLNNTVTFTFANDPYTSSDTNYLCWIAAQETAHSFGLDHEQLSGDPMTYLGLQDGTPPRHLFKNQNAACGADTGQGVQCYCPQYPQQNSYAKILGIFGAAGPTPPDIVITAPANGTQVQPGFQVQATITDGNGVANATLSIDGNNVQTISTPPYIFSSPSDISEGTHRVTVSAIDTAGTTGSAFVDVIIGAPCETPADCADQGDNMTCVGGRCVPGEGSPGGLGTECQDDSECYSGDCQASSDGTYCVEQCNLDGDDCPSGFGCVDAGDHGVCWPGADGGGGGGCLSTGGGSPTLPIALGLALGALTLRRRRK